MPTQSALNRRSTFVLVGMIVALSAIAATAYALWRLRTETFRKERQDCKENSSMPIISMFYGIIIRLYLIDNRHHNLPHIHAKYAEFEASIGLGDGEILAGDLPRKQLRLVQAWIELHRDELMADWELAASGENPYKIEPL